MYEINKSGARITITNVEDFDLDQILDCGQCFRWEKDSDSSEENGSIWYGVVGRDFARVCQKEDTVTIETTNPNEEFWIKYFDLDRDYSQIKAQLSEKDPIMAEAIDKGYGIRILKQDEWETVISFIISQNNNIPRIKGCIESLCREFGDEIGEYKGEKLFSFPDIHRLSVLKEDDFQVCRLGYRAKYLAEASRQIARDDGAVLEVASSMDDVKVIDYLKGISGIGPKVASCIMLFSMAKLNIFPIDVWVKRVMNRLYGIAENDIAAMKEYADEHFGKYGGIAQQYLFYYIRTLADTNPDLYNSLSAAEEVLKFDANSTVVDSLTEDANEVDDSEEDNPLGDLLEKLKKDEPELVAESEVVYDNEPDSISDADEIFEEVEVDEVDEISDMDDVAESVEENNENDNPENKDGEDTEEETGEEEVDEFLEELMRSNAEYMDSGESNSDDNSEGSNTLNENYAENLIEDPTEDLNKEQTEDSTEKVIEGLEDFKI